MQRERSEEHAGLCPTCRAPLRDGRCGDCGAADGDVERAVAGAPLPATAGAFRAEPVTSLPARRTAQPPAPPSVADVTAGFAVCRACAAKNPWDALRCGRCGEELPPVAPVIDAGRSSTLVGAGTHRAVNLVATGDDPDCFTRVAPEQQFVPDAVQRELGERVATRLEGERRLEVALPLPMERRLEAALTAGVGYCVASFVALSCTNGLGIALAPVAFAAATGAAFVLASRPSPELGVSLFLGVGLLVPALGTFGLAGAVLFLGVSALTGGFAGHLLREQRSLLVAAPDDPRHERARRRGQAHRATYERGKVILAGATSLLVAWAPAAFASKAPLERGLFLSFAVLVGATATLLLARQTARGEERERAAKRAILAFAVVGVVIALSYLRPTPVLAVLGLVATILAGGLVGRRLPSLPAAPEELPLPPVRFDDRPRS